VSPDPASETGAPDPGASGASASEEERARAAYEAELSRISSADMILQAAVSLLNIGARRLAPAEGGAAAEPGQAGESQAQAGAGGGVPGEGDLEQVRDAIDAVRALLEILERRVPEGLRPLRDALAQLQVAYARQVEAERAEAGQAGRQPAESGAGPEEPAEPGAEDEQAGESPSEGERRGPGPAEASGRLWVPGR
jgi:hypothetical protein